MSAADLFIKLTSLPVDLRKEVESLIEKLMERMKGEMPKRKPIPFGKFKGKIRMADDFDAPLEDFKDYM